MSPLPDAADLLRALGLVVDGPARWGSPPASRAPGIFVIEAPVHHHAAPIDVAAVQRWLERVPSLRLDGERPTATVLTARLAAFWLPGQAVLYVGRTAKALGPRVAALYATELGHRRPHPGGHWLKTLRDQSRLRLWWAETDATEEYEDALSTALADSLPEDVRTTAAARGPVLPWANLESPTGERRETGITDPLIDPALPAPGPDLATAVGRPPTTVSPGSSPPRARASRQPRRSAAPRAPTSSGAGPTAASAAAAATPAAAPATPRGQVETHLTSDGLAALQAELDLLTTVRRPEVVARVKHARELGDLRENADYEAARNEQSFLEGRVRDLQGRIRTAVIIEADTSGMVAMGSTVRCELEGATVELTIVGSTEADPAKGRISRGSPVGRALLGHRAGETVTVRTPAAEMTYRIVEVR